MTGDLRFNVLGPWEVSTGPATVAVPHGRLTVLLASLLLSPDEPVSIDTLVERLWPDRAPVRPRETLHTYVTRLRKLLGRDVIVTGPGGGYRLRVGSESVDLHEFRVLVGQARNAGSASQERELLQAALRLWRGKPFGDVSSAWLDREVVPGLIEEWLSATERRIDLDLAAGLAGTVIAELRELTRQHALRESLWFRLVAALHGAGRRGDALAAYEQARTVLDQELGVGPGEQLAQLGRTLAQNDARPAGESAPAEAGKREPAGGPPAELVRVRRAQLGLTQAELAERAGVSERTIHGLEAGRSRPRASTARLLAEALGLDEEESKRFLAADSGPVALEAPDPEPVGPMVPAQLPPDVGDFAGRASELAAMDESLPVQGDSAVRVLAGAAGVGKTALAVRWAHRVAGQFPDGQLYVNLRGFSPDQPVPPLEALAEFLDALDVPAGRIPAKPEAAAALYRSLLAGRRMLILLDNALDADQVRPLLPSGTGSLVLVTSRNLLSGLVVSHGARQLPVEPLAPAEALELVTQVVGADRVAHEPDATAALVAECAGLPLALRVAAANIRVDRHLDIRGYVAGLRAGDRLASLEIGGDTTASVRAAFDWSYDRLPAPVQRLFRQLCLVPGPDVTPEAAAALTATDLGQAERWLRTLADAHLLDRAGHRRFALHDLLRAYAASQSLAGERDAATDRLLRWYLQSTVAATSVLSPTTLRLPPPPPPPSPSPPTEAEPPVVRPANVTEAREWLAAERRNLVAAVTYAAGNGRFHELAWLLADALRGCFETTGNRVDWITVARAALAAATAEDNHTAQAAASSSLAHVHHTGGEFDAAAEHAANALAFARQAGWTPGEARALNHLAVIHAESGDLDKCVELLHVALELDRRSGDRSGEAKRLMNLATATQSAGRLREALDYHLQAVDLLGADVHDDIALANLGHLQHHTGSLAAAEGTLNRAVAAHADNDVQRAYTLVMLAELCLDLGRPADAEAHAQAAVAIAGRSSDRANTFWAVNMLAYVEYRVGRPGPAAERLETLLRDAGEHGYLSVRCNALASLADAQRALGRLDEAERNAEQSLKLAEAAGRILLESEARMARAEVYLARFRRSGSGSGSGSGDASALGEAAAETERTLAMQRWMGHRVGEARSLIVLGDIRSAGGDVAAARELWRSALSLCAELGLPDAGDARARLGDHA